MSDELRMSGPRIAAVKEECRKVPGMIRPVQQKGS